MTDRFGRCIDYMRVSITDRCNLRCRYCMPDGIRLAQHCDILSYEDILRICGLAVSLGIVKFKVTGGEPLVRKGCTDFITRLKALPGVEQVTITTNGLLLMDSLPRQAEGYQTGTSLNNLDALCDAGIDGINISLDTMCEAEYKKLTGYSGEAVSIIKRALVKCTERDLRVKVNTVLLARTLNSLSHVAGLAAELPVDVRFIELMPIGKGTETEGISVEAAFRRLTKSWPDIRPIKEKRGNGPAHYYTAAGLKGRIGFIDAMSHRFCGECNRVRLTATGDFKPCLCYDAAVDLRALLRNGRSDTDIMAAMNDCMWQKPRAHCFSRVQSVTEKKTMNRIGG